jgi:hypothetical protein
MHKMTHKAAQIDAAQSAQKNPPLGGVFVHAQLCEQKAEPNAPQKPTAEQVRAAMPEDLLAFCDAARQTFNARLVHLSTPTLTIGRLPREYVDG